MCKEQNYAVKIIEQCIQKTVDRFTENHLSFFREADVSTYCVHLLLQDKKLSNLVHMEYPSQVFTGMGLKGKKSHDNNRGRFDLVVLTEEYRGQYPADGKEISILELQKLCRPAVIEKRKPDLDGHVPVFHAVIEFKFCYESLSEKRLREINSDFCRVNEVVNSGKAQRGYVVYFQRLLKSEVSFKENIVKLDTQDYVSHAMAFWLGSEKDRKDNYKNSILDVLSTSLHVADIGNNFLSGFYTPPQG
ncbi:MAG: hypothetical protein JW863_18790 [Chitinispirillaceae bacterium]|nr:hypothetical protein [Chitinispirillaceae bacterium]